MHTRVQRVVASLVQADYKHPRVGVKYCLRAIAMVHIPVDDGNALQLHSCAAGSMGRVVGGGLWGQGGSSKQQVQCSHLRL